MTEQQNRIIAMEKAVREYKQSLIDKAWEMHKAWLKQAKETKKADPHHNHCLTRAQFYTEMAAFIKGYG